MSSQVTEGALRLLRTHHQPLEHRGDHEWSRVVSPGIASTSLAENLEAMVLGKGIPLGRHKGPQEGLEAQRSCGGPEGA